MKASRKNIDEILDRAVLEARISRHDNRSLIADELQKIFPDTSHYDLCLFVSSWKGRRRNQQRAKERKLA